MLRIQGMLQQTQDELERTNKEVSDVERSRKITQQRVHFKNQLQYYLESKLIV